MLKDRIPQRKCIGCMTSRNQNELIRMTCDSGSILIDRDRKLPGRGFYLCSDIECLDKAIKRKSFNRILKGPVTDDNIDTIRDYIKGIDNTKSSALGSLDEDMLQKLAARKKVMGLLGFATKSRNLVTGYNTCLKLIPSGKMKLLIIAEDVGDNTRKKMLQKCDTYNVKVRVFGTCDELSLATGKEDKGLFGVTDGGFAQSITKQIDEINEVKEVF